TASAINASQAGAYWVTVTDAFGCTAISNIINVSTIPVPTLQVFPDTLITFGQSVVLYTDINLSSASIDSFVWYPAVNITCTDCANPIVTPEQAMQYYGVNVYSNGCTATDSTLIRVIFPNNFFIPNAFTPNGDGNNDGFYIQAQGGVKVLLFQVFNRQGEKVHEGSYPWDGNYKGKPSAAGVYVYIFKLGLFGDEQSVFRKGSVTLIR
ncbi:MAG: gliding motility-associated C-terminal domain-containing protein, partial [Bacteroidota bacterium]